MFCLQERALQFREKDDIGNRTCESWAVLMLGGSSCFAGPVNADGVLLDVVTIDGTV